MDHLWIIHGSFMEHSWIFADSSFFFNFILGASSQVYEMFGPTAGPPVRPSARPSIRRSCFHESFFSKCTSVNNETHNEHISCYASSSAGAATAPVPILYDQQSHEILLSNTAIEALYLGTMLSCHYAIVPSYNHAIRATVLSRHEDPSWAI